MNEYHKIQTAWDRDPDTKFRTLIEGQWARPEFGYLADLEWLCEEKIDGTNIRVIWDGESVIFRGKTDNSQMPPHLQLALEETFPIEKMRTLLGPITLYGEGYGAKIQKAGPRYNPDGCGFILFDAFAGGLWLERGVVRDDLTKQLGLIAPPEGVMTLHKAIALCQDGTQRSAIAHDSSLTIEGFVMRPAHELIDRRGRRVITKIKCKDFRAVRSKVA